MAGAAFRQPGPAGSGGGLARRTRSAAAAKLARFTLLRANKTEVSSRFAAITIDFEGLPATVTAIRDITQRQADAARIARLTHHDALTGLPNRALFAEMLAGAMARNDHGIGTTTVFAARSRTRFKRMNEQFGRGGRRSAAAAGWPCGSPRWSAKEDEMLARLSAAINSRC